MHTYVLEDVKSFDRNMFVSLNISVDVKKHLKRKRVKVAQFITTGVRSPWVAEKTTSDQCLMVRFAMFRRCRIMSNVDKDLDYMISPQEFYTLLSQKFEKDDPKEEAFLE